HALDTLHRLHQLGLAIALDDFGTGYSSLSRLQHFPVNSIKIDKSFVDGISDGGQGAAFARVVIQLARIVGVESVAEGVECPDQLNQLAALDCDSAQGYIFSPPVPPQQATSLLAPTV
ncbi:MAG TPA: EAL domain-containing protein, partial [Solirubrobacteraceae bacterium]|nr:EAL domain-containing protein [Solirubrobacteraceae bacterium]